MRARYYSPELRRFINADIIAGEISEAITLNRYAYANGNPVSFVDPFGLSAERGDSPYYRMWNVFNNSHGLYSNWNDSISMYHLMRDSSKYGFYTVKSGNYLIIKGARTPVALKNGYYGTRYALKNADEYWDVFKHVNVKTGLKSEFFLKTPKGKINGGAVLNYAGIALDTIDGIVENVEDGTRTQKIVSDAIVDAGTGAVTIAISTAIGSAVGSVVPVAGNLVGAGVGFVLGSAMDWAANNVDIFSGKSFVDATKEGAAWVADRVVDAGDWISDTASDAWDATTDFFEDAGDAIGGFFSGLFA